MFTPFAAASIGQVHEAISNDGQRMAIKIQYPGVRSSIDSDINNVAALLKLIKSVPIDTLAPLIEEARVQLHAEADYLQEADHLEHYASLLSDDDGFIVPRVHRDLTTSDVLAMEYVEGVDVESQSSASAAHRDRLATRLLGLTLQEFFQWGVVQTDPNYANFRYQPEHDRIVLLDFGATRHYPQQRRSAFAGLMLAGMSKDVQAVFDTSVKVGYMDHDDPEEYRQAIHQLIDMATEPARHPGPYDFSNSDLSQRMSQVVMKLRLESDHWRMPPPDILFLHRKLGGLYMLCSRLGARVDVGQLIEQYVSAEAGDGIYEELKHG